MLRGSNASGLTNETTDDRQAVKTFKEYIRKEYRNIATLPVDEPGKAVAR